MTVLSTYASIPKIKFTICLTMHPFVNIAVSAAKEAGQIIQFHAQQLDRVKVSEKSSNDFVSNVDVKAEQVIIDTIRKVYPDHGIIAEESGISQSNNDEYTWIIDPLDGTTNFIHGFPFYGVSIAVKHKNKIEHGVVYDPIRQELFSASRGQGAMLNNKRIRVNSAAQQPFSKTLIGTGFPFRNAEIAQQYFETFSAIFNQCAGVRRAGAAALDLAYVAAGRLDGFWEFGLKPWDLAAGVLLIKEAGGLVCDSHGMESYLQSGNIVAGTPKTVKSLLQLIKPLVSK